MLCFCLLATGIARSIPAGQSLRQQPQYPTTITPSNTSNDAGHSHAFNTNRVRSTKLLTTHFRNKLLFSRFSIDSI